MLPEKLSNGLCSLNPGEDRLAMVCDMVIGAKGEIEAYQFFPAVIHSHARFTYTEVAAILANTRGPESARRADLVPHLVHLHDVYRALLKQRSQRGAIDFETTETQIVCDDNGRIEKIVPRARNEAHRLIEEAMLAANVCSADFIAQAKHAALYRVHEGPTPEKKVTLQNYLKALGLGLSVSDDPKPREFQAIADATKDRPDALQIHTMLLRSMQQASTRRPTAATSGWPTMPIRTSPARFAATPICWCTASSRPCSRQAVPHRQRCARGSAQGAQGRQGAQGPCAGGRALGAAGAHCSANERRCRRSLARCRGLASSAASCAIASARSLPAP